MLYKMVKFFESVDEILKCDHANELGNTFVWHCLYMLCMVSLVLFIHLFIYLFIYLFQSVAEIIKESDHSIKSYREVFPCGAVFKALRFK